MGDKFAGKQGPCPKCKTIINIPKASEEVKIHAPEDYGGAKSTTGKLVLKPISRTETKLKTTWVLAIGVATLVTLGLAYMIGRAYRPAAVAAPAPAAQPAPSALGGPAEPDATDTAAPPSDVPSFLLGIGALLLSLPLVLAGYTFVRNDELEPYRGQELWIRAGICAWSYAVLWGVYAMLGSFNMIHEGQSVQFWLFAGPAFFAAGGAAAYLALDLEFGPAVMLYGFYLGVTVALRLIMGLNPV